MSNANRISYLKNLNEFRSKTDYNMFSSGIQKGCFNIPEDVLYEIVKRPHFLKQYTLTEKKTPFYRLMFDLDFKDNYSKYVLDNHDMISYVICENLVKILGDIFVFVDDRYIFCRKNHGNGVHLYFPNIIVDCKLHEIIWNILYKKCAESNKNISEKEWLDIIDNSVTAGNNVRLPYFYKGDKCYMPSWVNSTYTKLNDEADVLKVCLTRTNAKQYNSCLTKYATDLLMEKNIIGNKKDIIDNKKDIIVTSRGMDSTNSNSISDHPNYVILDDDELKLFNKLIDLLSMDRIDNYTQWIQIVCLGRTYNQKDKIIEISKKSKKFNEASMYHINRIWSKEIKDGYFSLGSLIEWCKEDNLDATKIILEEYHNLSDNQIQTKIVL